MAPQFLQLLLDMLVQLLSPWPGVHTAPRWREPSSIPNCPWHWDWKWSETAGEFGLCSCIQLSLFLVHPHSGPFPAFLPNCSSDWPRATSVPTLAAEASASMNQSTSSHNCVWSKPYNKSLILITQDGSTSLMEPWQIIPILQIQVVPVFDFYKPPARYKHWISWPLWCLWNCFQMISGKLK